MSKKNSDEQNSFDEVNDFNKLSGKDTFIYSLASVPNVIIYGIFALTYVNFFWDDLQLQQTYFVIGQIIYMLVNSFNDFFLGRMSDNTNVQKRGSRRLVYIKWGGPAWALIFFLMWFPWSYDNQFIIFLHFTLTMCAFDMFFTLVVMCWMALLPEITENLNERNKIQFFNQIIGSVGSILVVSALFIFETSLQSFQIFCLILAIISSILFWFIGSNLEERPELYKDENLPGFIQSIKETFKSRSFVSFVIYSLCGIINGAFGLQFLFAYLYLMGTTDIGLVSSLYLIFGIIFGWIGSLVYLFLNKSKEVEMHKLIIRGRLLHIILNIIGFFLLLLPGLNPLIWIFIALGTVVGGYTLFSYPYLMMIVDDDEVITEGARREGMFLGANSFIMKFGDSIGPIMATSVLLIFGFVRDAPTQTTEAILGIKILFFIIPSIISTIGLIAISFYPIKGEYLKEMRVNLLELHEKKARPSS